MWTCHTHTLKAGAHLFFDCILLLLCLFLEQLTYFCTITASMENGWIVHICITKQQSWFFFKLEFNKIVLQGSLTEWTCAYSTQWVLLWSQILPSPIKLRCGSSQLSWRTAESTKFLCAVLARWLNSTHVYSVHVQHMCMLRKIRQGCFGFNNIYDLLTHVGREVKWFPAKV